MSVKSALAVVLGLGGGITAFGAGCGVGAVGVDACRTIEEARCEAAASCTGEEPYVHVDDVAACKRFYHDQCLHGLSVDSEPSKAKVNKCVKMLRAAGNCVRESGQADVPLTSCDSHFADQPPGPTIVKTACELLSQPNESAPCGFLTPDGPTPADGGTHADVGVDAPHESSGNDAPTG